MDNKIVEEYFTVKNFGVKVVPNVERASDIRGKSILESTKVEDRYQSGLLWKDSESSLPNNYEIPNNRLIAIENKMKRDSSYKATNIEAMNKD